MHRVELKAFIKYTKKGKGANVFLMHRVELKVVSLNLIMAKSSPFLMHRVELKGGEATYSSARLDCS